MLVHVVFMGWTIFNAHHPELFVPGLLFFLGFAVVTADYQNFVDLKAPLLVGFFLAGLVTHGGVQGWWIEPVLGGLGELPLALASTALTAFNDNAAITYLSTLVPGFTDGLKYAVVAGAVSGGGLTVIANAPNPAGQAILKDHFEKGITPVRPAQGGSRPDGDHVRHVHAVELRRLRHRIGRMDVAANVRLGRLRYSPRFSYPLIWLLLLFIAIVSRATSKICFRLSSFSSLWYP